MDEILLATIGTSQLIGKLELLLNYHCQVSNYYPFFFLIEKGKINIISVSNSGMYFVCIYL